MESNEYLYWYEDDEKGQDGAGNDSTDGGEKSLKIGLPLRPVPLTAMVNPLSLIWTTRQKKRRTILMTTRTFPT